MYHVTRFLVLLAVVATLVIGDSSSAVVQDAPSVSNPPYGIVELETLGGEASRAYSINERGWVAGHLYDAEGRQRAVLWKDGDAIDIGTLGGDQASALNVNDRGQIVGDSTTTPGADPEDPGSHAFLWQAGWMRDLGHLGGDLSTAQDVNERGQIVGASTTAPGQLLKSFTDGPHAFLWEDGRMTDLGTLGGDRSWALAINDAGQVVGTAQTADGEDHAFLWEDGLMIDLGTLGGEQAVALAINRHGQVVGGSTTAAGQEFGESGSQPFRWEANQMDSLGDTSRTEGIAYGISDRGGIVGSDPRVGAVLWYGGEAVKLTDLLPAGSGWEILGIARAIDEQGQIVGWGQRDGETRAFLASPATLGVVPASAESSATPAASVGDLEVAEVVKRAQRAIQEAGTFRYEVFPLNEVDGEPDLRGEVEIGRGLKTRAGDGSNLTYFDGQKVYTLRPDGSWWVRVPTIDQGDSFLGFLESSPAQWELVGMGSFKGQPSYVIEQIVEDSPSIQRTITLWIDATTFLPHKLRWQVILTGMEPHGTDVVYTDFGAPADVSPPADALAPTPTPEPLT